MNGINILLVEDEEPKRKHIERFLSSLGIAMDLSVAASVNTALDELEKEKPSLLLLDMSLPTFEIRERETGGRPQGFGGIEILRHMVLSGIECPTVVITGYEAFIREGGRRVDLSELRAELQEEFPHQLRGVLHYNSTYEEWKTELEAALESIAPPHGEKR